MPVRCAVCEADNLDDAAECASCGKPLAVMSQDVEAEPVAGLEATLAEPVDVEVPAIAGLEPTGVASRDLEVEEAPLPDVAWAPPTAVAVATGGVPAPSGSDSPGART